MDCCSRNIQSHGSPTVNADLALKEPTRSSRLIVCDTSKVESRVSIDEPEPRPLQTAESHVSLDEPELRPHQTAKNRVSLDEAELRFH